MSSGINNLNPMEKKPTLPQTQEVASVQKVKSDKEMRIQNIANSQTSAINKDQKNNKLKNSSRDISMPKGKEIVAKMPLDKSLQHCSPEMKKEVIEKCIEEYEQSVLTVEGVIGDLAYENAKSKDLANNMLNCLNEILKASEELSFESGVNQEEIEKKIQKSYDEAKEKIVIGDETASEPEKFNREAGFNRELHKELKVRLAPARAFGSRGEERGTGIVGYNPIAIENVIKEGSLREKMTLIYSVLWSAFPPIIGNQELVDKINSKLQEKNVNFQIDTEALNQARQLAPPGSTSPWDIFFPYAKQVVEFRNEKGPEVGRIDISKNEPKAPGLKYKEDTNLSVREARALEREPVTKEQFNKRAETSLGEHRIDWIRGKDYFQVNENSDFYKKALDYAGIPVVSGPSGTADGFLQALNYLGMGDKKNECLLACIGWMVSAGDHSFHEIKEAGTWHNLPYQPGPEAFNDVAPQDEEFQSKLQEKMKEKGMHLPEYYISEEHQREVLRQIETNT